MSALREAVEAWIRAEYFFRLGKNAYSSRAQDALVKAEDALRKACTGKRYLRNAAKRCGVKVRPAEVPPRPKSKPAKKSGLFD